MPPSLPPLLCPACHYDLHSLPPAHPCPECGHTTPENTLEFHGWLPSNRISITLLLLSQTILFTSARYGLFWILIPTALLALAYYLHLHRSPPSDHILRLSPAGVSLAPFGLPPSQPTPLPTPLADLQSLTLHSNLLSTSLHLKFPDITYRFYTRLPPHLHPQLPLLLAHLRSLPSPPPPSLPRLCPNCNQSHPFDLSLTLCPHCHSSLFAAPVILPPAPPPHFPPRRILIVNLIAIAIILTLIAAQPALSLSARLTLAALSILLPLLFDDHIHTLFSRRRRPELRLAPAGYQSCPPSTPLHLKPWPYPLDLIAHPLSISFYTLRLTPSSFLTLTVSPPKPTNHPLTPPQLRSLSTATTTWSTSPPPSQPPPPSPSRT